MANARIASLEAKLSASQKAYDVATAAKANAKKSQKSALAKAKKTEKALADANREHSQREQAVTERLRTMSAAAEGKYSFLSFSFDLCYVLALANVSLSFFFLVPLVVQDLVGCLCRLCNRAMTL
jgi:Flp pilus assembly protein TadB